MNKRYNDLNSYLRLKFGCRVQKITIDAGLTCPNRDGTKGVGGCIYCNSRGSGNGAWSQGLTIKEQLLRGKAATRSRYNAQKFIAYFQSFSNTYAPIEKLRELYEEVLAFDDVVGISIGTRPDCVNSAVVDMLQQYAQKNLVWLEYGLQSIHDNTLERINRGHDSQCFRNAVEISSNRGIAIFAHVILGLPGETKNDMLETARALASMKIDGVKIHSLYVVKNSVMEKLYNNGLYQCLQQREYAEIVCDFLELLPSHFIIQRLTAEPHPEELVAPQWCTRKTETINLICSILEQRDSFQGKRYST